MMRPQAAQRSPAMDASVESIIRRLAREASIEINVQDLIDLDASRSFLPSGARIFISFLPRQTWADTEKACRAVKQAGFVPVPHIPVRLLRDRQMLDRTLAALLNNGGADEVLLLSGDYPHPEGPYVRVEDVLETGVLNQHALRSVCFAGHPEGHPKVSVEEIRRAERAKAAAASASGLEVSLVTQFFFEAEPFLQWAKQHRAAGVKARLVAGLVGPAKLSTLVRYALRCGAGPSIRALGANPTAFTKLLHDHGPQNVLRSLAETLTHGVADFDGIHLFCFGGYLSTCRWLHRVANGEFSLNDSGGFDIHENSA